MIPCVDPQQKATKGSRRDDPDQTILSHHAHRKADRTQLSESYEEDAENIFMLSDDREASFFARLCSPGGGKKLRGPQAVRSKRPVRGAHYDDSLEAVSPRPMGEQVMHLPPHLEALHKLEKEGQLVVGGQFFEVSEHLFFEAYYFWSIQKVHAQLGFF